MNSFTLLVSLAALIAAGPTKDKDKGDVRTRAQVQAAREFAFEGVGLATDLKAFLDKYPTAERVVEEGMPDVGVKTYRVKELQTADSAQYVFLDDVLYQVTVFYEAERLKEMGGETIPLRKLVQKLGPQDKNSPGITRRSGEESFIAKWDFPDAKRRITFVATSQLTFVSIADIVKSQVVSQRITDKAELGF